jgi:hypothetical protein
MNYDLEYGKVHRKKTKTKLSKKMLDSMSLKKLKTIAKKYKISCYKKGTKECVKKSTLLKRIKKSRSINKILESASKMKKVKNHKKKVHKFGINNQLPANFPNFHTPLELSLGQTYQEQLRHYNNIPSSLISANFQGPANRSNGISYNKGDKPYNFRFTKGSMGRSSLPSYYNINDTDWSRNYPNKFGRYFR